jgi:hypothetical protein
VSDAMSLGGIVARIAMPSAFVSADFRSSQETPF